MDKIDKIINEKLATVRAACDIFRNTISASEYKEYILTFVFLKYISDVYEHEKQYGKIKYDNDDLYIERYNLTLSETTCFNYIYENRDKKDLGYIINQVLMNIEKNNIGQLDGVLSYVDYNLERIFRSGQRKDSTLKNFVKLFNTLTFKPEHMTPEIIGALYEKIIVYFANIEGKKGGQPYTPSEISTLLVKLVEPKEGDKIHDPTAGTGSLLIKAGKEVGSSKFSLFAQEMHGNSYILCKANIFLNDMTANLEKIKWGDIFSDPIIKDNGTLEKFNVIVNNPPFSVKGWIGNKVKEDRLNIFKRGMPPASKGDYAFISHIVETMNERDGRAGIIMPHGVLFRGAAEGKIRKALIEENLIDAVIGLPSNLFTGTSIPVVILIFKKNRRREQVLFIDASKEFIKGKTQNKLDEEHISTIYKTYKLYEQVNKYAYVATKEEIQENDYNLNIARYVDTFEEEAPINIKELEENIKELESELEQVQDQMKKSLEELKRG